MTDQEITRKIAELRGWRFNSQYKEWYDPNGQACEDDEYPPDFCNDLNAMHEIIRELPDAELGEYIDQYAHVLKSWKGEFIIKGTARQQAEAYLRMKGLWYE